MREWFFFRDRLEENVYLVNLGRNKCGIKESVECTLKFGTLNSFLIVHCMNKLSN